MLEEMVAAGAPEEALTDEILREVFGVRAERLRTGDGSLQPEAVGAAEEGNQLC